MDDKVKAVKLPIDARMPGRLAGLLEYWEDKRAGRPAPSKAEMDPIDFPGALAHMLLARVEPGPPVTFRFSIVGEAVHYVHGHSLKGLTPPQLNPVAYGEQVQEHYMESYATWQPLYHAIYVESGARLSLYLRLILPLTDTEGGRISHLLAVELHEYEGREDLHDFLPRDMLCWLKARHHAGH